uniref:Receptor-type tyrosine-protein phosphatase epsilon n=1 Tax=Sarcophilus harrisii TaxID=9305 RepID=A0A7N4PFC8_SARHA
MRHGTPWGRGGSVTPSSVPLGEALGPRPQEGTLSPQRRDPRPPEKGSPAPEKGSPALGEGTLSPWRRDPRPPEKGSSAPREGIPGPWRRDPILDFRIRSPSDSGPRKAPGTPLLGHGAAGPIPGGRRLSWIGGVALLAPPAAPPRVILSQTDGIPGSDYINASYIDGYKEKNKFIAAQGPKQETVNDFWRMIWEQKSATIVMLTNLKERKEEKCHQYWPDQGCWMYGNIRVSVEDCIVLVDYTIRKFCIQSLHDGCKAPRLVTQLHFTSWPDFGVPFTPIGMLKFLKKVKTLNPSHAGPITVHCSAGVGRSGTFIVIDAIIDMMHAEQKVDVFEFVSRIRNQRPQMVQTDMQYTFIYQALLEYYLYGDTELDVASLEKHLQSLHSPTAPLDKIGLEEEFRKLTNVRIMKENMRTGNLPANMKKARVIQIIPYDFNRVILSMKRGQEYTDYINASFIDGYRQKDYFIATQGPLPHTVEDFWRMVWEWKCHTIVMLTEVQEREQEKCFQYWPADGSVTYGEINIELKSDTVSEAISVRDFMVTFNQEKKSRLVRQFHFHGWPEIGIPAEGKGMIDLIAAVQKQQQQTGNHPITVHCRNSMNSAIKWYKISSIYFLIMLTSNEDSCLKMFFFNLMVSTNVCKSC